MTSPLELPELTPAVLDEASVQGLFTDLAFEAQVLAILLKGGGIDREHAAAPNLRAARDALLAGHVTGVQIRYVLQGVEWWDTLMRTDAGIRIVRVRK